MPPKSKRPPKAAAGKLPPVDAKTRGLIIELANEVAAAADKRRDPWLDIPTRSLSNVRFNKARKIIEMGGQTNRRQLFNLSQAKSYMQTLLVATGCKQLIDQQKTTSSRGLYYLLKHTIEGTREETFGTQEECDPIIEDLEVTLESLREELHVYASNRGGMVGPITLVDSGDEIDCARMGSGGYSIPSIVEADIVKFKSCDAKFILHVEKDTVWRRFNEDKFWRKHSCLLTHGGGQPPRGVRRMLYRLHNELKLPVYCLLDNDPWGYYIYSVLKQGSINLAYESKRMAIPLPVVRGQEGLAKGDRDDARQRLQARGRVADLQGHQLRDRHLHTRAARRGRLARLIARETPASCRFLLRHSEPQPRCGSNAGRSHIRATAAAAERRQAATRRGCEWSRLGDSRRGGSDTSARLRTGDPKAFLQRCRRRPGAARALRAGV